MPKVMMISGAKALGSGDIGARGSVPMAGAYRSPIGRLIGHANLGAVHGSADAIRAGLMLPLLRGAGVGAMRSLNYPSAALHYPGAALRGVGLGSASSDRELGRGLSAFGVQLCKIACAVGDASAGTSGKTGNALTMCNAGCDAAGALANVGIDAATHEDPTGGDPTEAETLRRQRELEQYRRTLAGESVWGGGPLPYNAPPPAPAPAAAGVPNWVYYAGAAAGVGLLVYAVLGGKRRR